MDKKKDPLIQQAEALAEDIRKINRHSTNDTIKNLQYQFKKIRQNEEATKIIEYAVEKEAIQNTLQYGGKGNSFCFMGTAQAEKLVEALGTSEQKKHFQKIKPEAVKHAQKSYLKTEEDFVHRIKRELEIGKLANTLKHWQDAYLKHNNLEGKSSDDKSEKIYQNEIKKERSNALQLHKNGGGKLSAFIEGVMSAVDNASDFNETALGRTTLGCLSWEEAWMLVMVYGTSDQIRNFTRAMPQAKENIQPTESYVKCNPV